MSASKLPAEVVNELLHAAADAAIVTDADGRIVFANRGAETLFGYAAEELVEDSEFVDDAAAAIRTVADDLGTLVRQGAASAGPSSAGTSDESTGATATPSADGDQDDDAVEPNSAPDVTGNIAWHASTFSRFPGRSIPAGDLQPLGKPWPPTVVTRPSWKRVWKDLSPRFHIGGALRGTRS